MSFRRLPDTMARYATYELAELLAQLTPAQRDAVGRIVQHVYINNRPWAHLFDGDDKICSETTYYRRGVLDEETGEWKRQGWNHQPEFKRAIEMARRLALQTEEAEELAKLRKAKRRAVEKAESAVDTWVNIMEDGKEFSFARIQAADRVTTLAFRDQDEADDENSGIAGDWWGAALDDD